MRRLDEEANDTTQTAIADPVAFAIIKRAKSNNPASAMLMDI
jgi:hypothetical protein